MDSQRITDIKDWLEYERELYTRFVQDKDTESLHLVRARVCFMAFRDLPELLAAAEGTLPLPCGHPQYDQRWLPNGKEFCVACAWIDNEVAKKKKWEAKLHKALVRHKAEVRKGKKRK